MSTIGPDWSDDPDERARQVAEQERLVSEICDIEEHGPFFEWELEMFADEARRKEKRP